ncbi:hypothetical protein CR513_43845, partial [Mucuna pruriens]
MEIFADQEINDTLIVLIPKIDRVQNMKNFRPISLCNVTYKTMAKILAQRLRYMMQKLSFVQDILKDISIPQRIVDLSIVFLLRQWKYFRMEKH